MFWLMLFIHWMLSPRDAVLWLAVATPCPPPPTNIRTVAWPCLLPLASGTRWALPAASTYSCHPAKWKSRL